MSQRLPGPWPAVEPQEWRAWHRLKANLLLKHALLASISATWQGAAAIAASSWIFTGKSSKQRFLWARPPQRTVPLLWLSVMVSVRRCSASVSSW